MPPIEPHYRRIRRLLEMKIRRQEFVPGDRIPGERELAARFGVSQMTANRAVRELVQDGMLERRVGSGTYVLRADDAVAPNGGERIVLVTTFAGAPEEDVYLQAPLSAIGRTVAEEHCKLVIKLVKESAFIDVVDEHRGAAMIYVAPSEHARGVLCALHSQGVPCVVLGASWPDAPFACVDSDNRGGARVAVDYLARLGHTRIGFINGDGSATNCRDRLSGYRDAMLGHGLPAPDEWVVEAGSDWALCDAARRRVTELVLRHDHVTAFVSAGFYLSLDLLGLLRSLQLSVPHDVGFISFDDPAVATYLSPPVSTVRQPLDAMGRRAVLRALSLLRGPVANEPSVEYLPVSLVIRGSCERRAESAA